MQDFRDTANYGDGISWYLLKTKDFVNYEEMGDALPCGSEDEQDLCVYTGSVFERNGKRRFLIEWIPMRNEGKDYGYWHCGGDLTAREIIFNADGTLSARCYDEKAAFYTQSVDLRSDYALGSVKAIRVTALHCPQMTDLPLVCKIRVWQAIFRCSSIFLFTDTVSLI